MALAHGRERLLGLAAGLLLYLLLARGVAAAFAVMPAVTVGGGLLGGYFVYGFNSVKSLAAIERIEFILLDDGDELGGVVDVLGIAAIP